MVISKDFNSRSQTDLLDSQAAPRGTYKGLINYQNHAKFVYRQQYIRIQIAAHLQSLIVLILSSKMIFLSSLLASHCHHSIIA